MGLKTKHQVFTEIWEKHLQECKKLTLAYELAEQEYISKIGHRAYSDYACFKSSRTYHNKKS